MANSIIPMTGNTKHVVYYMENSGSITVPFTVGCSFLVVANPYGGAMNEGYGVWVGYYNTSAPASSTVREIESAQSSRTTVEFVDGQLSITTRKKYINVTVVFFPS